MKNRMCEIPLAFSAATCVSTMSSRRFFCATSVSLLLIGGERNLIKELMNGRRLTMGVDLNTWRYRYWAPPNIPLKNLFRSETKYSRKFIIGLSRKGKCRVTPPNRQSRRQRNRTLLQSSRLVGKWERNFACSYARGLVGQLYAQSTRPSTASARRR